MSDTDHGIMLGKIGIKVEQYCLTSETTTEEAVELLLLDFEEIKARNKRLEKENSILKRDIKHSIT